MVWICLGTIFETKTYLKWILGKAAAKNNAKPVPVKQSNKAPAKAEESSEEEDSDDDDDDEEEEETKVAAVKGEK